MKYVHEECIKQWIKVSNRNECELCGQPWTLMNENGTLTQKVNHACHILRVLALTYATLAALICLYTLLLKLFS